MGITPNALIHSDCLEIMQNMEEGSVDMVYLDPPDLSGDRKNSSSTRSQEQSENREYLRFIARVCQHAHWVLKRSGVLFFHTQPISVFSLRLILNQVFGEAEFCDEFVWRPGRRMHSGPGFSGREHDSILFYRKSRQSTRNRVFLPLAANEIQKRYHLADERGPFALTSLTVSFSRPSLQFEWRGIEPPQGNSWRFTRDKLEELERDGRIYQSQSATRPRLKVYASEGQGVDIGTIWTDIPRLAPSSKENTGYPTQKPLGLVERLVLIGSNAGDLVFDPFCGSGTSVMAAQRHNRLWIGCDIAESAIDLTVSRISSEFADKAKFSRKARNELDCIPLKSGRFKPIAVSVENSVIGLSVQFILNQEVPMEETRYFEFKEIKSPAGAVNSIVNNSDEYAVAFLNSEGGRVYWGIRDKDRVVVGVRLTYTERDKVRREVTSKLNQIEPRLDPSQYRIEIHEVCDDHGAPIHEMCVVEMIVPAPHSKEPFYTGSGDSWVKVDGGKQKLKGVVLTDFIRQRLNDAR